MRIAAVLLAVVLLGCETQQDFRDHTAKVAGCWTKAQIQATDWPDETKAWCINHEVLPGMTQEQVIASWGKPKERSTANGGPLWIYPENDTTAWDGAYVPKRAVTFNSEGRVLHVSSS